MAANNMGLRRSGRVFCILLLATWILVPSPAGADIFDRNGGLLYSTADTGYDAVPFADLSFLDLTNASLSNASGNLFSANLNNSTLIFADMTGANLISANLSAATFDTATFSAAAVFTDAQIASANFAFGTTRGFSQSMLSSTKSYQLKDLIGVGLGSNDLSGWDLSHQNLAAGNLALGTYGLFFDQVQATYTISSDFTQSNLASVLASNSNFGNKNQGLPTFSGATFQQANLATINLTGGTLNGAIFNNANLSNATLNSAWFGQVPSVTNGTQTFSVWGGTISNAADLTDATISFANFSSVVSATSSDRGFRQELLYQTIGYQNHDLRGINLSNNDLTVGGTMSSTSVGATTTFSIGGGTWDFTGQDLTGANFSNSTLAINVTNLITGTALLGTGTNSATYTTTRTANLNALFNSANLSSVNFSGATLAGTLSAGANMADLTDATVNYANFSSTVAKGFTESQLDSTASYKNGDLRGINLSSNNLSGWNFSNNLNLNISSANFSGATLTTGTLAANFTGATIAFANFSNTTSRGFTYSQLQSTASYGSFDLRGINLSSNNLTVIGGSNGGWDLSNQNLASANFSSATLSTTIASTTFAVNFSTSTVAFANFSGTTSKGFTHDMLEQTASYANADLRGINLSSNVLTDATGWHFDGQNLTGASLSFSNATTTNFSGATLNLASLNGATLTGANFATASLVSANLSGAAITGADFTGATLTNANLSSVKLMNTSLGNADLTGANLSGATFSVLADGSDATDLSHTLIKGANLSFATARGFTFAMLNETDSYNQNADIEDLTGTNFSNNDMSGWAFGDDVNVKHMNLSSVSFASGTLSGAMFTHTTIAFANFSQTTGEHGLVAGQLDDSASWVNHDLRGINFSFDDLSDWNFTDQNLASVNFSNATLSIQGTSTVILANARIGGMGSDQLGGSGSLLGANFTATTGLGFTKEMLYSTASYNDHNLNNVNFSFNNFAPVDSNNNPLPAWDFSNQNLTGTQFNSTILGNASFNVDFSNAIIKDANFSSTTDKGFTFAMLQSTQSYGNHNLGAIGLGSDNLSGWDLSNQNLVGANFAIATLSSADFTGANIAGANFTHTTPFGFTLSQLYSTASYGTSAFLGSINLSQNNLSGADFGGQVMPKANFSLSLLSNANFSDADLQDVNFTNAGLILANFDRADLRGASGFTGVNLSKTNTILPDGTIRGLDLTSGTTALQRTLVIRDYNGASSIPIHVTNSASLDSTSTLDVLLKDGTWGSTMSFDPGLQPVTLGGATLNIGIDPLASLQDRQDIFNYTSHLRPIHLFSWTSPPSGTFNVVTDSKYKWDISQLYTTGVINLDGLYGDLNFDGVVDVQDLFLLAQHWGQPSTNWSDGDMTDAGTSNGVVDIADLRLLAQNWGFGTTSAASGASGAPALGPLLTSLGLPVVPVPEPFMAGPVMLLGAAALLKRRRRGATIG